MAITASQAQGLVLALFGASAGGHLAALKTSADAATLAGDLASAAGLILGQDLSSDEAFRDLIIDSNLKLTGAAQTEAKAWMDGEFAKGTSRADILTAAITFLEGLTDETNAFYATAVAYRATVADAVTWSEGAGATVLGVTALREQQGNVEEAAGSSFTLTTGNDVFTGTAGDDSYATTEANIEGDSDVLVDVSTTDNDTLTVTGTAFSSSIDLSGASIANIENVVVNADSLADTTIDVNGVNTASAITINQTRAGSGAAVTVNNVFSASTVTAGTDVNSLDVSTDTANHSVTVEGGAATGTIAATVTGTGTATVNAAAAGTVTVSAGSGAVAVDAAAATSVTASTTGAVSITAAGSTTADSIDATGNAIEITVSATDADIKATGDGVATTDDTVTVNAADDFVVTLASAFDSVTVNASAAVVATVDTTAATTYAGDSNTTFAGSEAMFDGKDVTGAAEVQITTLDASDLTGVDSAVNINVASSAASKTLTVATGAQVEVSSAITTKLTLKYSDGATANDDTGVLNVALNVASITGELALDATADTVATLNLNVATAPGSFKLTAGDTAVVATGSKALTLANTSSAASLNASAMTGVVTAEATTSLLEITTGAGKDVITVDSTSADIVVDTGAGNDTVDIGGAITGSIDGGTGTDKLDITAAVDISAATIANVEIIDLNTNSISVDEALVNAKNVVIDSTGTVTVKNILNSLDLSGLTFASTAATNVNFTTNNDATLGQSANLSITGSANIDTIVTGDGTNSVDAGAGNDDVTGGDSVDTLVGGAGADDLDGGAGNDALNGGAGADLLYGAGGNDSIVAGADSDAIAGGAGADTIDLTETTSVADYVTFLALTDGSAAGAAAGTFTAYDVITGFVSGTDKLVFDGAAAVTASVTVTTDIVTGAITVVAGTAASTAANDLTVADIADVDKVATFLSDGTYTTSTATNNDIVAITFSGLTALYVVTDAVAGGDIAATEIKLLGTIDATLVSDDIVIA
jgi:hypothetical protein